MVSLWQAAVAAASLLVGSAQATCPVPTSAAVTTGAIAQSASVDVLSDKFLAEDGTHLLGSCPAGQRVDILALIVAEQTATPVNVDVTVGYRDASANYVNVKTYSSTTCYSEAAGMALSFTSMADANPGKVLPYVTVTCKSTTGPCDAKVDVRAKCVLMSACPFLDTPVVTIAKGSVLEVPATSFKDVSSNPLGTCPAGQRLDLISVAYIDTTGAAVTADIGYQLFASDYLSIKTVTTGSCYQSAGAEVSFGVKADGNPDKVNPVVKISCQIGAVDCSVRYRVVVACVTASTCPVVVAKTSPSVANNGVFEVPVADYVDATGSALTACASGTQRLDIVSASYVEASGGSADASIGYQNLPADFLLVKGLSNGPCYISTGSELSFGVKANTYPEKVNPVVKLTCRAGAPCTFRYKVVVECVASCPVITSADDIFAKDTTFVVPSSSYLDVAGAALAPCSAGTRFEIVSLSFSSSASVTAEVGYQSTAVNYLPVKFVAPDVCFRSSGTELSFASRASTNPDKINAVVKFVCKALGGSCTMKSKVVAQCVAVSAACPTLTSAAIAVARSAPLSLDAAKFVAAAGSSTVIICSSTERVEVASLKVVETNGAIVAADVRYQKDASSSTTVKTFDTGSCYSPSTGLGFPLASADVNPDKVNSIVTISCLTSNTADCSVKYEIIGTCVTKSASCPTLAVTEVTVAKVTTTLVDATQFVTSAGTAIACATTERIDVVSLKVVESYGLYINVGVRYQKDASSSLAVKTFDSGTCYSPSTSLGFSVADANPDKVNPIVAISCASTVADCKVKYQVVGTCVTKSASCPTLAVTEVTVAKVTTTLVDATQFVTSAGTAIACATTERIDVVSLKVVESYGLYINVGVRYQKDAANSITVRTFGGGVCYSPSAGLEFPPTSATANPDKINPVVDITCTSAVTDCRVKYQIVGTCVARSAGCPTIASAAVTVTRAAPLSLDATKFVTAPGGSIAVACSATERADVMAISFVEALGMPLKVDIRYQKDASNAITVKSFASDFCSATSTDLGFPTDRADVNPDKINAIVAIACLTSNAADCSVKYEVVARCVPKSLACSGIASSAAGMTIARGTKTEVIPATMLTYARTALACVAPARVNMFYAKIAEINGANINVNVGYRNAASTRLSVASLSGVTCYEPTALSFTARAGYHPDKDIASFVVECPSMTADCSVKYEIFGECLLLSAACPALAGTAVAVKRGQSLAVDATKFVTETGAAVACNSAQRPDIGYVAIVESIGASVSVDVGYQRDATTRVSVLNLADVSCYEKGGPDLAFTTSATPNTDGVSPLVVISCLTTNAADCSVKYAVVAQCVSTDSCPAISSTPLAIAKGSTLNFPLNKVVDAADAVIASCAPGKRLDIVSTSFVETSGLSISADVKYQQDDGANPTTVVSLAGGRCYEAQRSQVSFAALAASFPERFVPALTISCASAASNCAVMAKVVGECVAVVTPVCPVLTSSAQGIKKGAAVVLPSKTVLDACSSAKRYDLQSAAIADDNGASLEVSVTYQKDSVSNLTILARARQACYQLGESDLSFASRATANPDKATPVFTITCAETNAADCSVRYKVAGKCVDRSTCPVLTRAAETVALGSTLAIPSSNFVGATKENFTACLATHRVDIASLQIVSQTSAAVSARVVYQRDSSSTLNTKTFTSALCYSSADLSFSALADANPDKVDAAVLVSCNSTTASCAVKYEVVAKCVPRSSVCTSIVAAAEAIAKGTRLEVPLSRITSDLKAALACTSLQRVDVVSAEVLETSSRNITVDVGYQNTTAGRVSVKQLTGGFCYEGLASSELSFAAYADANPDKVTPNISVWCASAASNCTVKYEVVGKCVSKVEVCPSLSGGAALSLAFGDYKEIGESSFVAAAGSSAKLSCLSTQRVDMVSAIVLETTQALISVDFLYRGTFTSVGAYYGKSCYSAGSLHGYDTGEIDSSLLEPVAVIACLNPTGCKSIRFEIIGKCVAKIRSTTGATTSRAATSVGSGLLVRALAVLVALIAGGLVVYRRQ